MQREPAYLQQRPVYVQPEPVYAGPPVFVPPREAFDGPRWRRDEARFDWERERNWRQAEWHRHERHEQLGDDRDHDRDNRMRHHEYRD